MKYCIWLIAILLAAPPPVAFADSTPTRPPGWTGTYQVVSSGGRFVLVMLNGSYAEPDASVPPGIAESNKLLLRYDRSGLYSNDGTTIPHWTMPYIPENQGITLSSDGHHLVVWGGWAWKSGTYREHALSIYQDGQESARYTVRDLVAYPEELPHTVSHYQWMAENSLDDSRGVLVVRTLHDETYTFDLSSTLYKMKGGEDG